MAYHIRLVLMTVIILACGYTAPAVPDQEAGPSHIPTAPQAGESGSFFAAGKIHQVFAAGPHVWLIADQSSGANTGKPWLVRTDTNGSMQASTSMRDIPELEHVNNWSRTPLAATRSGGIAMLIHNQENTTELLEFDVAGSLARHRSLDHLPDTIGGLMGLEFDEDHWLVIGSQRILRLNNSLEVVRSWAAEDAGFVVAYTMDQPAYISVVLVQKDQQGYHWFTRRLDSTELTASPPVYVAESGSRHFLVEVFAPNPAQTVVVMPDIKGNPGTWNLIEINSTGKLARTAVRIPQDIRKVYETRVFVDDFSIHFLSIDERQAWHTVVSRSNKFTVISEALSLPRTEFETTVTNLRIDRSGDRLYVGTNYRIATDKQSIRAAALLLITAVRPASP